MPLLHYRVPKIARRAALSHMNDYDSGNQSRGGRPIKSPPVRQRFYRDWNQRTVIVEHVLQRPLGRNKNVAVDLSERLDAFSPLLFDAAMDAQWIYRAH